MSDSHTDILTTRPETPDAAGSGPPWVWIAVAAAIGLAALVGASLTFAGIFVGLALLMFGCLAMAAFHIVLTVNASGESTEQALLVFFVPIYPLYYLASRWPRTRFAGWTLAAGVATALASVPVGLGGMVSGINRLAKSSPPPATAPAAATGPRSPAPAPAPAPPADRKDTGAAAIAGLDEPAGRAAVPRANPTATERPPDWRSRNAFGGERAGRAGASAPRPWSERPAFTPAGRRDAAEPPAEPRRITRYIHRVIASRLARLGEPTADALKAAVEAEWEPGEGYVTDSVEIDLDRGEVSASVTPGSRAERLFDFPFFRLGLIVRDDPPAVSFRMPDDLGVTRGGGGRPAARGDSGDSAVDDRGGYAGPGPVAATGRPVTAETPPVAGELLQARWGSRWYPVTVVSVDREAESAVIRWNGWRSRTETRSWSTLALAPPGLSQPTTNPADR